MSQWQKTQIQRDDGMMAEAQAPVIISASTAPFRICASIALFLGHKDVDGVEIACQKMILMFLQRGFEKRYICKLKKYDI
jgi:hypothetical protein